MTLIPAATAPQFTLPGTTFHGLAAPSRGACETAVWKVAVAPGTQGLVHQLTREEIFVCIAGTGTAHIGGTPFNLDLGDALIVPPDTDFSLQANGDAPFEAIAILPVGGQARLPGQPEFTPPWAA